MVDGASAVAPVLRVVDLDVRFRIPGGVARAVNGVSFDLWPGETLAIVGESGCGKSVTAMSVLRLIPSPPGVIAGGRILLDDRDLRTVSDAEMRRVRGNEISMIFQEPMTALNPVLTVGYQIAEALVRHEGLDGSAARARAVELLDFVRIPEPARRAREYPHQLSGGMRQRAMIAMALACKPKVLIADEPTTALDVTIQAQILNLIVDLQKRLGTAVILITHDLAVVAETADRVLVMYAGSKVEEADVAELFARPLHPYTRGLLESLPRLALGAEADTDVETRLAEIRGIVPALTDLPPGCAFAPRCPLADTTCQATVPPLREIRSRHTVACHHATDVGAEGRA
jgi:peptide/nickel transport system ATP-binding protein